MGHNLQAIIGRTPVIDALTERFDAVVRVALRQGFEMVPVIERLHDEIAFAPGARNPELAVGGFSELGKLAKDRMAELSHVSPVAYICTEYFGGVGEQAAVAFVDGQLATPSSDPGRVLPWSSSIGPINDALSAIGVRRGLLKDEFERVGLGHHRDMDEWEDHRSKA